MKIIPSSKRHRYVAIVSIVLVAVALVVGMVSWLSAPSYDLTIASTAGGSVTTPGEGTFTYDEGTVVNLVAEAEEGYHFVNWTGNVGTIADINDATTTITMLDHYSITANFAQSPTTEYDLIINSTAGGSVTTPGYVYLQGTFTYNEGDVVNLVATPDAGYQFVNWTGNVGTIANVNSASTTITMNGDYTITANFAQSPTTEYDLIINSTEGGSVTTPGYVYLQGTFTYNEGDVVNLVATPDAGYQFVNWTGNVGTIANVNSASTTITMNGDYTITANFAPYMVAAGYNHTVGLKSDGTLVAVGFNQDGECAVGGWTDIVQVAAGGHHTVGLKTDGTVVAVGHNDYGQCDVSGWTLK